MTNELTVKFSEQVAPLCALDAALATNQSGCMHRQLGFYTNTGIAALYHIFTIALPCFTVSLPLTLDDGMHRWPVPPYQIFLQLVFAPPGHLAPGATTASTATPVPPTCLTCPNQHDLPEPRANGLIPVGSITSYDATNTRDSMCLWVSRAHAVSGWSDGCYGWTI